MSASTNKIHGHRSEGDDPPRKPELDRTGQTEPTKLPANHNLPERYVVKTNGDERILTCLEAPNLSVHIENGISFSASIAKKSPSGTIFLDGVAQCEPFMDHERQVYNLDHHEGCVRSFTLATCEQALVMYMKGLDLQSREWNIFANEPDLDTLLAIWIILNHARIGGQDATQRRILFALVRYEGVVDALGLELKELSALPPELMRKIQRVVDHLRSDELAIKRDGSWEKSDFLSYTTKILHKIDQIFYKASDFIDYHGVEELARIDLTDKRIAAVVEADMGIYEIEPYLNKLYGNRLGVVFLKKGAASYTVRQMDLFMPLTLDDVYDRLNFVDPSVRCRTQANKWGGAAEIGGSPRESGTELDPLEIVQACREAVSKSDWKQRTSRFAITTALIGFIVLIAHIVRLIWSPAQWLANNTLGLPWIAPDFGFMIALLAASGISLLFVAYSRPWQYGWSMPLGKQWWLLLPVAMAGGATGGLWITATFVDAKDWIAVGAINLLGLPLALELLFRSLAHGLMAQGARIQRCDSRWFLSWPILGSTLLYAAFAISFLLCCRPDIETAGWGEMAQTIAGALLIGLSTGFARERSQSVWPAVLFHMLAAGTLLLTISVG